MPKNQGKAKSLIHEMYLAPTRKAAMAAYDQFISSYQSNSRKPANAWPRQRSALSLLRLPSPALAAFTDHQPHRIHFCYRPITNSGNKRLRSRIATLTMVFKLGLEAQKHWRRQQGFELIQRSLPVFVSSMVKKTHRPLNLINQFN